MKLFTKEKIYKNQSDTAKIIYKDIIKTRNSKSSQRSFLIYAQMQSGKTGVISSLSKMILEGINSKIEDEEEMLKLMVITGVADVSLKRQTAERMPRFGATNVSPVEVWNNPRLKNIKDVKNCVIFIDETHVGNELGSQLDMFFQRLGVDWSLNSSQVQNQLKKRNIYVVAISATPYNIEFAREARNKIPPVFKVVPLLPGEEYFGVQKMLKKGSIEQSFNIYSKKSLNKHFLGVLDKMAKNKPTFMIVRCNNNFESTLKMVRKYVGKKVEVIEHHQGNKMAFDINNLKSRPNINTVIFIKNAWRLGSTLDTSYVSVFYDHDSSSVDTVSQSLLGRACGYGKEINNVKIYTNLGAAIAYSKLNTEGKLVKNTKYSARTHVYDKTTKRIWLPIREEVLKISSKSNYVGDLEDFILNKSTAGQLFLGKYGRSGFHIRKSPNNDKDTRNFASAIKNRSGTGIDKKAFAVIWYKLKNNTLELTVMEVNRKKEQQRKDKLSIKTTKHIFNRNDKNGN